MKYKRLFVIGTTSTFSGSMSYPSIKIKVPSLNMQAKHFTTSLNVPALKVVSVLDYFI